MFLPLTWSQRDSVLVLIFRNEAWKWGGTSNSNMHLGSVSLRSGMQICASTAMHHVTNIYHVATLISFLISIRFSPELGQKEASTKALTTAV